MTDCLKCKEDLFDLCDWDNIGEVITCPKCGNKMTLHYDEWVDDDWNEYGEWVFEE